MRLPTRVPHGMGCHPADLVANELEGVLVLMRALAVQFQRLLDQDPDRDLDSVHNVDLPRSTPISAATRTTVSHGLRVRAWHVSFLAPNCWVVVEGVEVQLQATANLLG